jgi:ribose/xylose/arabinose/galactoside ABC-type transport system permease subunit
MLGDGRRPAIAGWGLALTVFALLAAVSAASPEFRTLDNLGNVARQSATLGALALGQTFVVLTGLIDLSVGALAGLTVVLVCDLMQGRPELAGPGVGLALAIGTGVGILTGTLQAFLRIHPLILTFGMLSVLQGVIFTYTDRSVGKAAPAVAWLANGDLLGVPAGLVLVLALGLLAHLVLSRTRFGLHIYAVGGNRDNARRAGVDPGRVTVAVFAISGLSAGIAGLLLAGRLGTGYPHAGAGYELDAIVAVVLGGTSLAGGRGTIAGTLAAVLVLGLTSNILNLLQVSSFVQMLLKGLIIVAAIVLTGRERREARA